MDRGSTWLFFFIVDEKEAQPEVEVLLGITPSGPASHAYAGTWGLAPDDQPSQFCKRNWRSMQNSVGHQFATSIVLI
jgi:hypothetical protein